MKRITEPLDNPYIYTERKTRERKKLDNKKVMYYKIATFLDTILNGNR